MSDISRITYRAALLNAALATLGVDAEWDRRLTEFLRLDALQNAFAEYGGLAEAGDGHTRACIEAKEQFGPRWGRTEAGRAFVADAKEASVQAEKAHVDDYLMPYWAAGKALVLTPAPSVKAAAYKAFIIEAEEIWNERGMPDCVQIVADDFARLLEGF